MSKKLNRVAIAAGFLAVTTIASPVHAQSQEATHPPTMQTIEEQQSDYCGEAARTLRREMSRTDGDTAPALQSEQECRQQLVWLPSQS